MEGETLACVLDNVFAEGAVVVGVDATCHTKDVTFNGKELFTE